MSSTRPANHHRVQVAGESAAQADNRVFERHRLETNEPEPLALDSRNPETQTITLVLDATTASAAIYAIAAHADEREAHMREVQRYGQTLPEGSYGRRNRETIAARETRIAVRLRAVEHAYRIAIERQATFMRPEPSRRALCSHELMATGKLNWIKC